MRESRLLFWLAVSGRVCVSEWWVFLGCESWRWNMAMQRLHQAALLSLSRVGVHSTWRLQLQSPSCATYTCNLQLSGLHYFSVVPLGSASVWGAPLKYTSAMPYVLELKAGKLEFP